MEGIAILFNSILLIKRMRMIAKSLEIGEMDNGF